MNHFLPKKTVCVCMLFVLFLSGCSRQLIGGVVGGAAGGAGMAHVGKGRGRLIAAMFGTLAGALLGGAIGADMDERDKECAEKAAEKAFASNDCQPVTWSNPQTGRSGKIQVTRPYESRGCVYRKFEHHAFIDGRPVVIQGLARETPDGWVMVQQ